jgi:hypothetical protein
MTTSELPVLLNLYAQMAPGELFRLLQRDLGVTKRDGIYTARVVIWMMILQRLDQRGTLASTVEQLAQGKLDALLSRCKRVREKNVAVSTGGYCQARQNLPKMLIHRTVDEILQRLRNHLAEGTAQPGHPVYVLDGSSLQLDACRELKNTYPPARNPHRPSHWPILLMVVLQDVDTGLAQEPCWGPMYGPDAVSEKALAERALEPLPPGAVILGDRNFGIFAIAHSALQKGHAVVLRLTDPRAKRLRGAPLTEQGDYPVEWKAGNRASQEKFPPDTAIHGRLIAWRVGRGKTKQWLYLFTTLTIPAEEVVALYGKRWHVETDLRSLKQTVRLNRLSVQSVDMLEKELLAAVLAYNLVRAIMCLAARQAGVSARQLSFTYAYNIVQDGITNVLAGSTVAEQIQRMERIVSLVARCKLPNRSKRRSFPREIWGRGRSFPSRKVEN